MIFTKTTAGDVVSLKTMTGANREARVRRINKNEYLDCATGEILQYQNHGESRQDNKHSLYRTFSELRNLINANATSDRSVMFLTLTYEENMTDPERLTKDFKRFIRRFKRHHEKNSLAEFSWISVAEPQARGAWHLHVLVFYPEDERPFIKAADIADYWEQGFIKVKAVDHVDNLGAYLTPYLTDLVLEEDIEGCEKKVIDGKTKSILKGERLRLYKPGMKLYRASRNIRRSEKEFITCQEAEQFRSDNQDCLTYETEQDYTDSETGFQTHIRTEFFNLREKKKKKKKKKK